MERRATRASEAPVSKSTRRTVSRTSPVRKSPARKSPARKSPARTRAESNTNSPPKSKRAPSTASEDPPRLRGRPAKKPVTTSSTISETDEDVIVVNNKMSPKVSLSPLSAENIRNMTSQTSAKTKSSVTTTTSRVKVTGDDDNIIDLTAKYVKEARAKLDQMGTRSRFTPTPSDVSRLSVPPTRSVSRSLAGDHDEYSDNEDDEQPLYESFAEEQSTQTFDAKSFFPYDCAPKTEPNKEFYGDLGALFLILVSTFGGFYLQYSCTRKSCDLAIPNALPTLDEFKSFFTLEAAYLYSGFVAAIFVLFIFPLSRLVNITDEGKVYGYKFNGFAIGVLALAALGLSEKYLEYPTMKTVYRNYLQFVVYSILTAIAVSIMSYIRSKFYDPVGYNRYANSGHFLSDFYVGRQTSLIGYRRFDFKITFYRVSAITALLINSIFAFKTLKFSALPVVEANATQLTYPEIAAYAYAHVKYEPIVLLVSSLTLLYVLDLLWNESHMVRSFDYKQEGAGAHLFLRYALFPFQVSLMAKYAFEHKLTEVPCWAAWAMTIVFLIGLVVKRRSCSLKYEYRLNPSNPKFEALQTLPTFQGRRLIVDSYWRIVRHPNYLGEIICALSICVPLVWYFAWPPLIVALSTVALLVHRAHRIHGRQSARYNSAWTRYCQQVPYKLIPWVY